MKIVENL